MTLAGLTYWVADVPGSLPEEMRPMAQSICDSFTLNAKRLLELGLGYLTLDRAASTLSTASASACACPCRTQPHHRRFICAR